MDEGYTVAGQSMPNLTTLYGGFLILWGVVVSQISVLNSPTTYIPSVMGIPIMISGVIANKIPEKRKLVMHIAAVFGVLCALGGTRFFMVMLDSGTTNLAKSSMLMLFITGSLYTYACVQSFKYARKSSQ